jgi:hypothetical protein
MSRYALLVLPLVGCIPGEAPTPSAYSDCRAEDGDDYDIGSLEDQQAPVRVEDDTLFVTVGHSGGCETHDFQICWPDQMFMESAPVQVSLELWHDAHGDGCEAYLTEELAFDLAPLRDAWHDAYGAGPGTITIHVGGETVDYTFDG